MTLVRVFWQEQCPNCPPAKELGKNLEREGIKVEFCDVKNLVGLTHAIRHSIKSTPAIVLTDESDKEIKVWRSKVPSVDEVKIYCKQQ